MLTLKEKIEKLEKREIESTLLRVGYNVSEASRRLGSTPRIVRYKAMKYGIEIKSLPPKTD